MSKKPQEPKQDWGFYAVTPRVVRTQYKELSHAEKWLYTCLKDLCGDKGSCFRSLRSLSEETDISTGSLSKMIPHLHKSGLIHAEKKRRSQSGKEVWHISIVDIWQANAKYSKGCSEIEQSHEGTTEIVQNLNEPTPDCSKNEQDTELDCSNFVDRRINSKNTDNIPNGIATNVADPTDLLVSLETATKQQLYDRLNQLEQESPELEQLFTPNVEKVEPSVDKQASDASLIANPAIEKNAEPEVTPKNVEPKTTRNTSSKPRSPRVKVTQERKTEPLLSESARRVWDIWLDMPWNKAIPPKLTETAAKHCETLSQVEISKDIIFKVLNFAKKNDRNGFYDGKSKELGHVVSEYSRWKSVEYQVQLETPEKPKVTVGNRAMQSFTFK
jgi:hypothetical protein